FFAAHDVFFLFKSDSKKTIPHYGNIVALFGRYVAAKHQNIPTDVQAVVRGKHTDVYDRQARSGVGQLWRTIGRSCFKMEMRSVDPNAVSNRPEYPRAR